MKTIGLVIVTIVGLWIGIALAASSISHLPSLLVEDGRLIRWLIPSFVLIATLSLIHMKISGNFDLEEYCLVVGVLGAPYMLAAVLLTGWMQRLYFSDQVAGGLGLFLLYAGPVLGFVWFTREHFGREAPGGAGSRGQTIVPSRSLRKPGRLADQLRRSSQAGDRSSMESLLLSALPNWSVTEQLVRVAGELVALQSNVKKAEGLGVTKVVTTELMKEAQAASSIIWKRAERIAAVATFELDTPKLQAGLANEEQKLDQLWAMVREARDELAQITLAGNVDDRREFAKVQTRFRAIVNAAQALQDEDVI